MHPGILKVGSKLNRGISMLIYADPGRGKSTCSARLPAGETLIINVEAGLGPFLGTNHYLFNMKRDLTELSAIYRYLATETHPFKYVVVDNVSELQEWMLLSLTALRKKDFAEVREKGDTACKMRETLHNFRNLVERDINVIFNAWEMPFTTHRDPNGDKTRMFPKLYPSLAPEICGIVDMVAHLEVYEKTGDRFLRLEGNEQYIAKSQYRGPEKFEPADIAEIFAKVRAFNYTKAETLPAVTAAEIKFIKGGST